MAHSELSKRVNRGVTLLDKHRPGWYKDINLDKLVIASSCECVLGQLYGDFTVGCGRLAIGDDGEKFGFFTREPITFTALDDLWKKKILHLREKEKATDANSDRTAV